MRKLLQNKAVVGSLCAIAALFVVGNFVKLPVGRLISVAARPAPAPTIPGEPETLTVPPMPRICLELTGWRELFPSTGVRRDPFALPGGSLLPSASTNAAPIPAFALQAVSIEPGRALAVVNQTVVGPGEQLGDYVVERILPTEVWLKNGLGRVIVPMHRTVVLRTKSP